MSASVLWVFSMTLQASSSEGRCLLASSIMSKSLCWELTSSISWLFPICTANGIQESLQMIQWLQLAGQCPTKWAKRWIWGGSASPSASLLLSWPLLTSFRPPNYISLLIFMGDLVHLPLQYPINILWKPGSLQRLMCDHKAFCAPYMPYTNFITLCSCRIFFQSAWISNYSANSHLVETVTSSCVFFRWRD